MPPRKSNVSVGSNDHEEGGEGTSSKAPRDGMSVEDLSLPKSMIARLSKGVLPANTQIHKDALLALHKSTTVFVSYMASASNEIARASQKKTISPQDVMEAMKECEFEDFLDRLAMELRKYTDIQNNKRNTYRRKVKEEKQAASQLEGDQAIAEGATAEGTNGTLNGDPEGDDEDRPTKKLRAEDGSAVAPDADGMDDEDMGDDQDDTLEDADDQAADDEDDEGDDGAEDEDDEDEEPSENVIDAFVDPDPSVGSDDEVAVGGMRDEALDDPGSESD